MSESCYESILDDVWHRLEIAEARVKELEETLRNLITLWNTKGSPPWGGWYAGLDAARAALEDTP